MRDTNATQENKKPAEKPAKPNPFSGLATKLLVLLGAVLSDTKLLAPLENAYRALKAFVKKALTAVFSKTPFRDIVWDKKKAAMLFGAMAFCAMLGVLVVRLASPTGAQTANAGQAVAQQPVTEPPYTPSELPYHFGDGMKKAEQEPTTAPATEPAEDEEPTEDSLTGMSVTDLLYPNAKEEDGDEQQGGDGMNYIAIMLAQQAQAAGAADVSGGAKAEVTTANALSPDGASSLQQGEDEEEGGDDAAQGEAPDYSVIHEPVILMETDRPFAIDAGEIRYAGKSLLSGRAEITNRTNQLVKNAYLELTLEYTQYGLSTTYVAYAYAAKLNLVPGSSANIAYAAIPPVKGDGAYTLKNVAIRAFTTEIDGVARKVYVDDDNHLLELLDDGI